MVERAWDVGKLRSWELDWDARGREGKAEEGDKRGFKKWGRGAGPRCAEPGGGAGWRSAAAAAAGAE